MAFCERLTWRLAQVIWRRLSGDAAAGPKNWRKVHKTLALLDYLLKNGAVGVVDEASSHAMTFAALSRFSAPRSVAAGGGAGGTVAGADTDEGCRLVREKAAALLSLLDDTAALRRCRAEAQRSAGRFVGIGRDASGSRRSLGFGSDDAPPAPRGVTIATAGAKRETLGAQPARVRPLSLAGSSISARVGGNDDESPPSKAYSPPSSPTDNNAGQVLKPAMPAPAIAPPPASAFGPWTSARFASTSAPTSAATQPAPAPSDPFADIFAGVELVSPAPAESGAAGGGASGGGNNGGSGGGDPFASLLDAVDERISAAIKGPSTEPLCAEAAVTWNVGVGGGLPPPDAPDIGAALASATAAAPTCADATALEEARRQLAAVQLSPAMWGPGSSLLGSPRQPPQLAAPVFRTAPPPEPNLIDL